MLVFLAIMAAGAVVLIGGHLSGDHDHDFGHDHDGGHDHGGHDNQTTVSIFSLKVIGTFIMGFGGGGAMGKYYDLDPVRSSLAGVGFGIFLGFVMYMVLRLLYGHQANSLVSTDKLMNQKGVVTTPIGKGTLGEVNVSFEGQSFTRLARAKNGEEIPSGVSVTVVETNGGELVVQQVS